MLPLNSNMNQLKQAVFENKMMTQIFLYVCVCVCVKDEVSCTVKVKRTSQFIFLLQSVVTVQLQ
jgi:hypothetical protein